MGQARLAGLAHSHHWLKQARVPRSDQTELHSLAAVTSGCLFCSQECNCYSKEEATEGAATVPSFSVLLPVSCLQPATSRGC